MNKFGPDNLAVYICPHVFENTKPILLVNHLDGDWQFLCGDEHDEDELPKVVEIIHMLDRDPSLNELADLPIDWEAQRVAVGAEWIKAKCDEYNE